MGTVTRLAPEGHLVVECKFDDDEGWRQYQKLLPQTSIEQGRARVEALEAIGSGLEFQLVYVRIETTREVL